MVSLTLHLKYQMSTLQIKQKKKQATLGSRSVLSVLNYISINRYFFCLRLPMPNIVKLRSFYKERQLFYKKIMTSHPPPDFAKSFKDISFTQRFNLLQALIINLQKLSVLCKLRKIKNCPGHISNKFQHLFLPTYTGLSKR